MKSRTSRLVLTLATVLSLGVLAKAQTSTLAPPFTFEPITGAVDRLEELRAVTIDDKAGHETYAIVLADLVRLHPAVVVGQGTNAYVDPLAMSALLLALIKDLSEQNLHLNTQLAHVMNDKADLERKLHDLSTRFDALAMTVETLAAPVADVSARE